MTAPAAPTPAPVRRFEIAGRSTDVFGRVLLSARHHHFVADGPAYNGCPGEALTPPELLLTAIASCAVELVQVLARDAGDPIGAVRVAIEGVVDRGAQPREDVTVFNLVRLDFTIGGTDLETARRHVAGFQRRCPIYGTVSTAALQTVVNVTIER